jgi:hypothetical protein
MKSLWDRVFGRRTGPAERPAPMAAANDVDDVLEEVRERIRGDVASGFYGPDEILKSAIEMFQDDLPEAVLADHARLCLDEALAAHRAEQADWPETTDCDRLDSAFAALERGGIVMRQNFSCCGTCGSSEIWAEVKAYEEAGGRAYGYAFYHQQDTERAVEGGGIYLNYGACEDGEEPAIATARAIVAELERRGLETDWNGTWDMRIGVKLDWKRRPGLAPRGSTG